MASSLHTGLTGKVVLVTGASSGIGRYAAIEFSKNGCRLIIVGRRIEALSETAELCHSNGVSKSNILEIVADLENSNDCTRIISEAIVKFDRLDILVNAAGSLVTGGIENLKIEEYDKQMNLNCRSIFIIVQAAIPHLKLTKGNIVNVSSVTGLRSFPGVLSYCMSKSALDQFTRCVALEVAQYQIRCNSVNPGVIVTNIHKTAGMDDASYTNFIEHSKATHALGRVGQADEVAKAIVFLASNELSGFMTGVTLPVDGGRGIMCPR